EESLKHITNELRANMADLAKATTRKDYYIEAQFLSATLHDYLKYKLDWVSKDALHKLMGLRLRRTTEVPDALPDDSQASAQPTPEPPEGLPFQVHSLRPARRVGQDGVIHSQIVISLLQRRKLLLDPKLPTGGDKEFIFRGGCTLIFDLDTME